MNAGAAHLLNGKAILIVEDESLIAQDIAEALRAVGADVIGPAGSKVEARKLIEGKTPDFAILNIRLRGDTVFDFADELDALGTSFMFISGYGRSMIPDRFDGHAYCQKPVQSDVVIDKACEVLTSRP